MRPWRRRRISTRWRSGPTPASPGRRTGRPCRYRPRRRGGTRPSGTPPRPRPRTRPGTSPLRRRSRTRRRRRGRRRRRACLPRAPWRPSRGARPRRCLPPTRVWPWPCRACLACGAWRRRARRPGRTAPSPCFLSFVGLKRPLHLARGDADGAPLDRAEGRIAPIDAPLTRALPIAFGGFRRGVAFLPRARRSDERDPAAARSVSAVDWRCGETGRDDSDSQVRRWTQLECRAERRVARWCSWASPAPTPRLAASPWTTARRAGTTTPNPTSAPRGAPRTRHRTTASAVGDPPTARWRPCRTRGTPPSSRSVEARGITPGPRG